MWRKGYAEGERKPDYYNKIRSTYSMSFIVKRFNEVQAIEPGNSTPSSGVIPRILFGTDENNHVGEGQEDSFTDSSKPPAKKKPRRLFDDEK
jgi:hypothetical protein